jgi:hypothetical protein
MSLPVKLNTDDDLNLNRNRGESDDCEINVSHIEKAANIFARVFYRHNLDLQFFRPELAHFVVDPDLALLEAVDDSLAGSQADRIRLLLPHPRKHIKRKSPAGESGSTLPTGP